MSNIFETDILKTYLEDQAKHGWELTKIGKFILTFEKKEKTNVHYATGILSTDIICGKMSENNEYKDLIASFDYQFVGDRNGVCIFKTFSDFPFYTDEIIDDDYFNQCIDMHFLRRLRFFILELLMWFQIFLLDFSFDFISDLYLILLLSTSVFLLYELFNEYGLIPYIHYCSLHKRKIHLKLMSTNHWIWYGILIAEMIGIRSIVISDRFRHVNVQLILIYLVCFLGLFLLGVLIYFGLYKKRNSQMLELQSWIWSAFLFGAPFTIMISMLSGFKYNNGGLMQTTLICWLCVIVLGIILFQLRYRFLRSIEMSLVVMLAFIGVFITLAGANQKPIKIVRELNVLNHMNSIEIDDVEIPLSLCFDEACTLYENEYFESVLMKKQSVIEKLNHKDYAYDYYEIKWDFLSDSIMNQIVMYEMMDQYDERVFKDFQYYYFEYQDEGSEVLVRKKNQAYRITFDKKFTKDELEKYLPLLPWK